LNIQVKDDEREGLKKKGKTLHIKLIQRKKIQKMESEIERNYW
jgi:hypothetical protein